MSPTTVKVFAPAKINLALHVTGQRADGYHLLDTLVAFASVGDDLSISPGERDALTVRGPEGSGLSREPDNLALRAAQSVPNCPPLSVVLTKNLPVSSGIGGGSADAAAVVRAAHSLLGEPLDFTDPASAEKSVNYLHLGADVPMCLACRPMRATGIGEHLQPVTLPTVPAVLVNPRIPVSTPEVFRRLVTKSNAAMSLLDRGLENVHDLADWMRRQRNDLQAPAQAISPKISAVLSALEATGGVLLARMSGSGATCFGLYGSAADAAAAKEAVSAANPDWWCKTALIGDQSALATPRVS